MVMRAFCQFVVGEMSRILDMECESPNFDQKDKDASILYANEENFVDDIGILLLKLVELVNSFILILVSIQYTLKDLTHHPTRTPLQPYPSILPNAQKPQHPF
jgi:hypothetical protein